MVRVIDDAQSLPMNTFRSVDEQTKESIQSTVALMPREGDDFTINASFVEADMVGVHKFERDGKTLTALSRWDAVSAEELKERGFKE